MNGKTRFSIGLLAIAYFLQNIIQDYKNANWDYIANIDASDFVLSLIPLVIACIVAAMGLSDWNREYKEKVAKKEKE